MKAPVLGIAMLAGMALSQGGCEVAGATGSTTPVVSVAMVPVEFAEPWRVNLVFEETSRPFTVIATVTASASTFSYGSVAKAEGAALEQLRFQASLVEADAVVQIERAVFERGSRTDYNETVYGGNDFDDPRRRRFYADQASGSASTRNNLEINFRGAAVKWDD
ncbi:MAG: hypothetical protein AAGB34_05360 [Planctomycetota bacterium]